MIYVSWMSNKFVKIREFFSSLPLFPLEIKISPFKNYFIAFLVFIKSLKTVLILLHNLNNEKNFNCVPTSIKRQIFVQSALFVIRFEVVSTDKFNLSTSGKKFRSFIDSFFFGRFALICVLKLLMVSHHRVFTHSPELFRQISTSSTRLKNINPQTYENRNNMIL